MAPAPRASPKMPEAIQAGREFVAQVCFVKSEVVADMGKS